MPLLTVAPLYSLNAVGQIWRQKLDPFRKEALMRPTVALALPLLAIALSGQAPLPTEKQNDKRAATMTAPPPVSAKPWADWALRLAPVGAALLIGTVVIASRRKRP